VEVHQKLNIELVYDPAISLLVINLMEYKSTCNKNIHTLLFIVALFTIANLWNHPRCPSTDEWIRKCGTYTQ
jgi:hypothetical protein